MLPLAGQLEPYRAQMSSEVAPIPTIHGLLKRIGVVNIAVALVKAVR